MADHARGPAAVAATVVARGQLPAARVLARGYRRHHPDHDVVVLVADGVWSERHDGVIVFGYDELDVDREHYLRLATGRTGAELAAAATPLLVRLLLRRYDAVVVLAPHTVVLGPFPAIAASAVDSGLVLTPRLLTPSQDHAGGFDPDFVAVGRCARAAVAHWAARADDWLADVPSLFRYTVVRDPGYGLAWWNLHERSLTDADGTLTADGTPVAFVHLPGYDPDQPWLLNADNPTPRLSDHPELRPLLDDYRTELRAGTPAAPGELATLTDGTPITAPMRGVFRAAPTDHPPPHPFGPDGDTAFRHWLTAPGSPAEAAVGFNRLTIWLWAGRPDLRAAFPRPLATDADGYRQWCHRYGGPDGGLPDWALPGPARAPTAPTAEFGVNLAGYLTGHLGLGAAGRVLHDALRYAGIPLVSVVEECSLGPLVGVGLGAPDTVGEPRFPVSVLAVNADFTAALLANQPSVGHDRYRIGLWAWELPEFPAAYHGAFDLVDEVWVVSEFVAAAIAPHAGVPVHVFPMTVPDPGVPDRPPRPPGTPTRFLFAFDYNSTGGRKNPWGVVTAFQQAFPNRDDVRLVIKAHHARANVAAAERLRYLVADDPRIELVEGFVSPAELDRLYAASDAYVSLHRSEGFGLTLAEAMIRGLPVIATDYSGTTEYVTAETGWPIPYTMADVGPGWPPYPADGRWADPDPTAAAAALRAVADDPAEARRRGAAARDHLLRTRSMATAADWLHERITEARRSWLHAHQPAPAGPTRRLARWLRRELRG